MFAFLYVLLCLLAGRAFGAFNLTVGNQVLSTSDILNIPDSPVKSACTSDCSATATSLNNCNGDSTCLCRSSTVSSLLACEQCMFNFLVANFQVAPDPKAGSQAVLTAYGAACTAANQTLAATATKLSLAPNWNGPEDIILKSGGTVIVVIIGGLLGSSALYLLSNI